MTVGGYNGFKLFHNTLLFIIHIKVNVILSKKTFVFIAPNGQSRPMGLLHSATHAQGKIQLFFV